MNNDSEFSKLSEQADRGELTEESLQKQLNDYREAYRQEFEESVKNDPDEVTKHTQEFFKNEVPAAAAQMVWLAYNAESQNIQKDCLKFIIAQGLKDAKRDGDPIRDLLSELGKKPEPTNQD